MSSSKIAKRNYMLKLRLAYIVDKSRKIVYKETTKRFLDRPINPYLSISDDIVAQINSGKPLLVARLGGTEGYITGQYCERMLGTRKKYVEDTVKWMYSTSGFFADNYEDKSAALDKYSEMILDAIPECDYLSAVAPKKVYIPYFFKYYASPQCVATFNDYGPYFDVPTDQTWVRALAGKKVLVVNSFADSIASQYNRKSELVKSKEYELPDFELLTYKTMTTQVGERPGGYENFFEVLDKMLEDIKKLDFDIALIGAGAYCFLIGAEIKRMGKIAIEPCGNTPLFFGVYGERNLRDGIVEKYKTDAWIRPMEAPPERAKEVEGGCYW